MNVSDVSQPKQENAGRRRNNLKHSKLSQPQDMRSGRNPNGLNVFIPRRKLSDINPQYSKAKTSQLTCTRAPWLSHETGLQGLDEFLRKHQPSKCEVQQLCIESVCKTVSEDAVNFSGLLRDAARLEKSSSLSQTSVVELAKKWSYLSGKWLLFVPEWRIDELFSQAGKKLVEGGLGVCSQLIVSPPGSYGTDPSHYMFSAHCPDFTDTQAVMTVGKCFRSLARAGLRSPAGDWGELKDNPFASDRRKVRLVFKPNIFMRLNLQKNNPFGIKTTVYSLDL